MNERRKVTNGGRRSSDKCPTVCLEHSGFESSIHTLYVSVKEIKINAQKISSRTSLILGGVCISCILLAINILIKSHGG